jgi:alkylation response protein AidB-like acyl-CoA dehydrogenase
VLNLERRGQAGRAVSAAQGHRPPRRPFVGQNAVQLHGGMGMTDELPSGTSSSG